MSETGAIKFQCKRDDRELAPFEGLTELNAARQELRRLRLMGVDAAGIGFGNISLRDGKGGGFYITGTGSGGRAELERKDYARVVSWDFAHNWLRSEGRVAASAESLTHAALYAMDPNIGAVIHGHDHSLWLALLAQGAMTRPEVAYGTPEMAREVQRLLRESKIAANKIFAMAGHKDGIVAFGCDLGEALRILSAELGRARQDLQD